MKKVMQAFDELIRDLGAIADAPPDPTRRVLVLVVDDDGQDAELLCAHLFERHCDICVAHSGEEALGLLRTSPEFRCAFVDLRLPGMSGVELIRRIKAEKPKMRVLPITGHMDQDALEQLAQMGLATYSKNE